MAFNILIWFNLIIFSIVCLFTISDRFKAEFTAKLIALVVYAAVIAEQIILLTR